MKRDPREVLAILGGGAVGALARTGLSQAFPAAAGTWPWVTFFVNVAGAFALGYFVTRLQEWLPLSAYKRPFLGTGLCGALTTFSTVQVELVQLLDEGRLGLALGYTAATLLAGFAALQVATALVRRSPLRGPRPSEAKP